MTHLFGHMKNAGAFRAGADLREWLLSIMHNIFIDGTRARGAEAQRLKRAGELVEQELPPIWRRRYRR